MGVNYRALDDLFHISQSRQGIISYQLSVQMIEIYNEQVRDLLVADGSDRRYPLGVSFSLEKFYAQILSVIWRQ